MIVKVRLVRFAAQPAIFGYVSMSMEADDLELILATEAGEEWEEFCWGLLRRKYPAHELQYVPAEIHGDCGIEGFSADGIVYQCYADQDSQTLRDRTNKQKAKLNRDTNKLKTKAKELKAMLGNLVIEHYMFLVPQFHAHELVAQAAKRSQVVRQFDLDFIGENFQIRVKTHRDYPGELRAALADRSAKALVEVEEIVEQDVNLFVEDKPDLVKTLEAKLGVVKESDGSFDTEGHRDRLIRAFLTKEQIMTSLQDWPDTWESVETRRRARQELLELESDLNLDAPSRQILDLIKDYKTDLADNVGGLSSIDAQRIAMGQTGDWLMRCPLSFRGKE